MKFYLCQTAEGPRYERTKEDAKAVDPKFKTVDVATDQASLMAMLNDLHRRLHAAESGTVPGTPATGAESAADEGAEDDAPAAPAAASRYSWKPGPNECFACHRTRRGADAIGHIFTITDIEEGVSEMADPKYLARVDAAVEERRRELQAG